MSELILSESSIVRAAEHLASATAPDEGEVVIVDPVAGTYYGLSAYAVRVWSLIQRPQTVREIREALLAEYEVEPDVLLEDVTGLIRELAAAGLVEVRSGT